MVLTFLGFPMETVFILVVLVVGAIAIDTWMYKRNGLTSFKNSIVWVLFWLIVTVMFGGYLWSQHGREVAILFFTGYVLETTLSVDNLWIMMAIFSWFHIPESMRYRVLNLGLMAAVMCRLIFVLLGTKLLSLGVVMECVFALLIVVSAYLKLQQVDQIYTEQEDYTQHLGYRWVHQLFPVFPHLYKEYFFLRNKTLHAARAAYPNVLLELAGEDVKHRASNHPRKMKQNMWVATPLFLSFAVVTLSDVMLSFDTMPAVIAVSREPLVVGAAVILATLTLRALYFVLERLQVYCVYLDKAVIILLFFVFFKLLFSITNRLFSHQWEISNTVCCVVMILVLVTSIVASFILQNNSSDNSK